MLGLQLANKIEYFAHFIAPAVLILLGVFFNSITGTNIFIYIKHLNQYFPKKYTGIRSGHVPFFLYGNRSIFFVGRYVWFMVCYEYFRYREDIADEDLNTAISQVQVV